MASCPCERRSILCGAAAKKSRVLIALLLAGIALLLGGSEGARAATRPNIVFVLTDDLSVNLVQYMPNVLAMQKEGASFSNYFVTDSLCCPSRSSIFTGKLPHDTGVFTNNPPDGGYAAFNAHGNAAQTFAVALQKSGYKTAMLGKYLNGYKPEENGPPAGWDEWDVAGNGYPEFNYTLNQDGKLVRHGDAPEDYLTDVLAGLAASFIRKAGANPFFIEIATFAPHAPYTPAPRDADRFPTLTAPRSPAFGVRPDETAPAWLKEIPPLKERGLAMIDQDFRKRAQSVQAVDKMIGQLRALLAEIGAANTYIVFSSDNGYHMGEYSLRPGKMTPFDTDIRVPLIIVGPKVAKGQTVTAIAENIDLCPTFTELGSVSSPTQPDGHSLVALLHPGAAPDWRHLALIEHHRPPDLDTGDPDAPMKHAANPTTYEALRGEAALYVEYQTGEIGFYDLKSDPYELHNIASAEPAAALERWHDALVANEECHGAEACWKAETLKP